MAEKKKKDKKWIQGAKIKEGAFTAIRETLVGLHKKKKAKKAED
jgi:hypothetical protein